MGSSGVKTAPRSDAWSPAPELGCGGSRGPGKVGHSSGRRKASSRSEQARRYRRELADEKETQTPPVLYIHDVRDVNDDPVFIL